MEAIKRTDGVARGFVIELDDHPRFRRLTQDEWNGYLGAHGERWKSTMMERAGIVHPVFDERGNRRPNT